MEKIKIRIWCLMVCLQITAILPFTAMIVHTQVLAEESEHECPCRTGRDCWKTSGAYRYHQQF